MQLREAGNLSLKDHTALLAHIADKAMMADDRRVLVPPRAGDAARLLRAHGPPCGDFRGDQGAGSRSGVGR